MPEDLRRQIIEAIAASGDENYKRLLMLLLRVEEVFLEQLAELSAQMTVPAKEHAEDHSWIKSARTVGVGMKSTATRLVVSVAEKLILLGAGAVAGRFFG